MEHQIGIIIVAGGSGSRMQGSLPKQFLLLGGLPVLAHTINNFAGALPGADIVVVLPASYTDFWRNLSARFDVAPHTVAEGGDERFHSVRNGIAALKGDPELIAVQDGVRPLASHEMIRRTITAAAEHGTAVPVVEAVDTFREIVLPHERTQAHHTENCAVTGAIDTTSSHIVDRRRLRVVQTPQVFDAALLQNAYRTQYHPGFTDDASVVERSGNAVFLCEGERSNLKITTAEDMVIAQALLESREEIIETDEKGL